MSKLMEIVPTPESAIIPRVLVQVHRALDEHLSGSGQSARQFARTLVTGASEDTAIGPPPQLAHGEYASRGTPTDDRPKAPDRELAGTSRSNSADTPVTPVSHPTAEIEDRLSSNPQGRWKAPLAMVILLIGAATAIYVFFFS
jgi:hypothetical protein